MNIIKPILLIIYYHILESNAICCSTYSRNMIDIEDIAIVRYSSCNCKKGAAIIVTIIDGKEICVPDDTPWIKSVMNYMNIGWLSCGDEGFAVSNFFLEENILPFNKNV
nr:CPPV291 CC-chemokine family protein [Cooks petrelpox virus]